MDIETTTLNHMLDRVAEEHADEAAIVSRDGRLTYAEFHERVREFARGLLDVGVGKGDHVGVMMGNRPEWFVATYAIERVGATMVGLNTWYKADELRYALRQTDATALVTVDSFLDNDYPGLLTEIVPELESGAVNTAELPFLQDVVVLGDAPPWALGWDDVTDRAENVSPERLDAAAGEVAPRDDAYILFSSGTTGRPKPIVLRHDGLVTNARSIGSRLDVTSEDRFWLAIPLFFSFAACNETVTALSHGATIVLQEHFDAGDAARLIEEESCTVVYGMANMFRRLEALDADLADVLESVHTGLMIAPRGLRERFEDDYGVKTIHGYGLTEVCAICAITKHDDPKEERLGTVGHPLANVDVRIKDPDTGEEVVPGEQGEVCLRTRMLFREYYKKPVLTREVFDAEGYFHTGDIGWLDADGRLVFEGRMKDMIKTGGINVSPKEVGNVLEGHPEVEEAVVFGVPDEEKDEVVAASVRPVEGASLAAEDVIAYARERIASYKVPATVYVRETDFPRTDTGKVRKTELRDEFA